MPSLPANHNVMAQRTRPRNSRLRRDHRVRADLYVVPDVHQIVQLHAFVDARIVQRAAIDRRVRANLHVVADLDECQPAEISSSALRLARSQIRPRRSPRLRESPHDLPRERRHTTSLADESGSSRRSSIPPRSRNARRSAFLRRRAHPRRSPRTARCSRPSRNPCQRRNDRRRMNARRRSEADPATTPRPSRNATFGCRDVATLSCPRYGDTPPPAITQSAADAAARSACFAAST